MKKSNAELISIIVPIYNISPYIERCVESLINQSYKNIEIILVDDGSTDDSGIICDNLSLQDKRILVFHKENGGLSDARNFGIEKSTGKYLFFIDGDDLINNTTIEYLFNNLINSSADISTIYHQLFSDINDIKEDDLNITQAILNTEEALKALLYIKNCSNSACGKLFKKELFENIKFPKGEICEDLAIIYKLFALSRKVFVSSRKMYYYYFRQNSIVNSKFSDKRLIGLKFVEEETKFIEKNFPVLIKAAKNREFREAYYIKCKLSKKDHKNYKNIKKKMRKNAKIVLFDKYSDRKMRIMALISLLRF